MSKNIARRAALGRWRRFNTCIALTGVPEESRKDATIGGTTAGVDEGEDERERRRRRRRSRRLRWRVLPRESSKFNIESIGENLIKLLPPEATRRLGFRPRWRPKRLRNRRRCSVKHRPLQIDRKAHRRRNLEPFSFCEIGGGWLREKQSRTSLLQTLRGKR